MIVLCHLNAVGTMNADMILLYSLFSRHRLEVYEVRPTAGTSFTIFSSEVTVGQRPYDPADRLLDEHGPARRREIPGVVREVYQKPMFYAKNDNIVHDLIGAVAFGLGERGKGLHLHDCPRAIREAKQQVRPPRADLFASDRAETELYLERPLVGGLRLLSPEGLEDRRA